jgi:nucleoside-triphosphatase THEP1
MVKILLTGPPGIGKTTLFADYVNSYQGNKRGIISQEIRDINNERIAFKSIFNNGNEFEFMKKKSVIEPNIKKSNYVSNNNIIFTSNDEMTEEIINKEIYKVGSYFINIDVVNNIMAEELKSCIKDINSIPDLIYIDEIGHAQSYSLVYLDIVKDIFKCNCNIIATIVYQNTDWSTYFKLLNDVWLIEVNINNRDSLLDLIHLIDEYDHIFIQLSTNYQNSIKKLFINFLNNSQFISAKKLIKNTIMYLHENKINLININNNVEYYELCGKTNQHYLNRNILTNNIQCDCPLYLRLDKYELLIENVKCSHEMCLTIELENKDKL